MKNNTNTNRKNKTNLVVEWPQSSEYFTIQSLNKNNSSFKEITLRVRLNKEISNGKVQLIGTLKGVHGRPENVYALTPVSKELMEKAKTNGVVFVDGVPQNIVPVVSVNSGTTQPAQKNISALDNILTKKTA
jgi:hypothetical protein